jgi:hypothetical protein
VAFGISIGSIAQLGDERVGLVTGELPPGLSLGETHGTTGITKVLVPGLNQQLKEFTHLVMRRRGS